MDGKTFTIVTYVLICLYFVPCVHSISSPLPYDSAYTSQKPIDLQRTLKVRILMLNCSGISATVCLVAFYWFFRMKKQFRHQLIMFLLYGDLTRATWYFIFAAVSLRRGTVRTDSPFCQSSGFLMQYGETTSDYSVLVIAVHSALQVFHPVTRTTSDGLYTYRLYVYAGAFVIPSLTAGLAFINSRPGYQSLGAACTLPIRPFWYRLALAWVPRYLIALIIIGLAIVINIYVRLQLRSINQNVLSSQTTQLSRTTCEENIAEPATSVSNTLPMRLSHGKKGLNLTQGVLFQPKSLKTRESSYSGPRSLSGDTYTQSVTESVAEPSMRIARAYDSDMHTNPSGLKPGPNIGCPSLQLDLASSAFVGANNINLAPAPELLVQLEPDSNAASSIARRFLHVRRQLRPMFIYPLVYTLMWLIPFANHCTMYMDRYVQQPVWGLRLGATICLSSMGFIDCLIFFLRESPWRRTVVEMRSRKIRGSTVQPRSKSIHLISLGRLKKYLTDKLARDSSDVAQTAAAQARVRLELERAERLHTRQDMAMNSPTARADVREDLYHSLD